MMKEENEKVEAVEDGIVVLNPGMESPDGITRCCWGAFGVFMS